MPHAFISHSKHDAELAQRVAYGLESNGAPCWIAPRDIPPAEDYADALEAGVTRARVVVFLASAHSMGSRYCRAELEIARADEVSILPVLLDETPITGGWRIYLSGHQWLRAEGAEEAWIADLATSLKRLGVLEDGRRRAPAREPATRGTEAWKPCSSGSRPTTRAARRAACWPTWPTPAGHAPARRAPGHRDAALLHPPDPGRPTARTAASTWRVPVRRRLKRAQRWRPCPARPRPPPACTWTTPPRRGGSLDQAVRGADHLAAWADGADVEGLLPR
ncbi:MAG: toll/interleukin-1 receptor domain-containing protein [Acidimicrobiales bacterium]